MRCASIDIGTNTLRLLIADVERGGPLKPIVYKRAITRLGGDYTERTGIDRASAERTFAALEGFKKDIKDNPVETIRAVATSVVRRARNRDWFLREVTERTGITPAVITGAEEARMSLLGVLSVIDDTMPKRLVMDIGGGSTEFIATSSNGTRGAWSMEMGVVHLTEAHIKGDPPDKGEMKALEAEVGGTVASLKAMMKNDNIDPSEYTEGVAVFIGTAGTVTTLAAVDQGLEVYDRERINNYTLTRERVRTLYEYLTGLTLKERSGVLSLEKGREDLIIPGAAITLAAMEAFGFNGLKVIDAGLLEGVMLDGFDRIQSGGSAASPRGGEACP
ncbi:MAG: Ppx/GppA family phosphatase [Deltaproteobacteria bacterium]|nr:Ppx/GppA family phosphatase [Deltaproteobacteria bacterium]